MTEIQLCVETIIPMSPKANNLLSIASGQLVSILVTGDDYPTTTSLTSPETTYTPRDGIPEARTRPGPRHLHRRRQDTRNTVYKAIQGQTLLYYTTVQMDQFN